MQFEFVTSTNRSISQLMFTHCFDALCSVYVNYLIKENKYHEDMKDKIKAQFAISKIWQNEDIIICRITVYTKLINSKYECLSNDMLSFQFPCSSLFVYFHKTAKKILCIHEESVFCNKDAYFDTISDILSRLYRFNLNCITPQNVAWIKEKYHILKVESPQYAMNYLGI